MRFVPSRVLATEMETLEVIDRLDDRMMSYMSCAQAPGGGERLICALSNAHELLTYPALPPLCRVRAHLILACSSVDDALEHAYEGRRLAKLLDPIAPGGALYPEDERLVEAAEAIVKRQGEEQERRKRRLRSEQEAQKEMGKVVSVLEESLREQRALVFDMHGTKFVENERLVYLLHDLQNHSCGRGYQAKHDRKLSELRNILNAPPGTEEKAGALEVPENQTVQLVICHNHSSEASIGFVRSSNGISSWLRRHQQSRKARELCARALLPQNRNKFVESGVIFHKLRDLQLAAEDDDEEGFEDELLVLEDILQRPLGEVLDDMTQPIEKVELVVFDWFSR